MGTLNGLHVVDGGGGDASRLKHTQVYRVGIVKQSTLGLANTV